jgi:hypothetical protein
MKPAEEGGTALRFWNLAPQSTQLTWKMNGPFANTCHQATHVETITELLGKGQEAWKARFRPQQMRTFLLR